MKPFLTRHWQAAGCLLALALVCLALAGARALGVALPQTANAQQLFQACDANGMGQLDHSALVRALELMAKHEVAKAG